jgi:DNA-binding transcriptional LysR family regulator
MLAPALAGFGLADLPEERVGTHLAEGRLVPVFADWCEPFSGFHL